MHAEMSNAARPHNPNDLDDLRDINHSRRGPPPPLPFTDASLTLRTGAFARHGRRRSRHPWLTAGAAHGRAYTARRADRALSRSQPDRSRPASGASSARRRTTRTRFGIALRA